MAGSLSWIDSDNWPIDGWPYADTDNEGVSEPLDPNAEVDDDLVALHVLAHHLLDDLNPLERQVVASRFGLYGQPVRTMKQLQHDLGVPRADLRTALGAGLEKLRAQFA